MRIDKPKRYYRFTVTCTEEERRAVFEAAKFHKKTVSGYIRWLLKRSEEDRFFVKGGKYE